jgi:hypothetical protein
VLGYVMGGKWKVFFDASLTCSRVLLMVGDLAEDSPIVEDPLAL